MISEMLEGDGDDRLTLAGVTLLRRHIWILDLLVQGKTRDEIGRIVNLAKRTVDNLLTPRNLSGICAKTGVNTLAEAIAWWVEAGKPAYEAITERAGSQLKPLSELYQLLAETEPIKAAYLLADRDFATSCVQEAIGYLHTAEFPPPHASLLAVSSLRDTGMRALATIFRARNTYVAKGRLWHQMLAPIASITLSHYLSEIGQHQEAEQMASEGVAILDALFNRSARWQEEEVVGYPTWTMAELRLVGHLRAAMALRNQGKYIHDPRERQEVYKLAGDQLYVAEIQANRLSEARRRRWLPGVFRDQASLLMRTGDYEEAETKTAEASEELENVSLPDDALLLFLCQTTLAGTLVPQRKWNEVQAALDRAETAPSQAQKPGMFTPGPLHWLKHLRTYADYYLARARDAGRNSSERITSRETWKGKTVEAYELAKSVGLKDQEKEIGQEARGLVDEFRRLLPSEILITDEL